MLPARILPREIDSAALGLTDAGLLNLTHLNWEGAATRSRHLARTVLTGPLAVDSLPAPAVLRAPVEAGCDMSVSREGWYLDDVVVQSCELSAPSLPFEDGFESCDATAWSNTVPSKRGDRDRG